MEEKVIDVNEFRKEQKRRERREKFNSKISDGLNWVNKNREAILVGAPIVIGAVKGVSKLISKGINLHKEKELKDLRCYDRSGGHYWRLKRELTTQEWLEFDKRKSNGERVADILTSMRVLK